MRTAILSVLAMAMVMAVAIRFRRRWSATWLALYALLGTAFLEAAVWNQGYGYLTLGVLLFVVGFLLLASWLLKQMTRRVGGSERMAKGGTDTLGRSLVLAQLGLSLLVTASEAAHAKRIRGTTWDGMALVVGIAFFLALDRIPTRRHDLTVA